jgi:hypothetical protein
MEDLGCSHFLIRIKENPKSLFFTFVQLIRSDKAHSVPLGRNKGISLQRTEKELKNIQGFFMQIRRHSKIYQKDDLWGIVFVCVSNALTVLVVLLRHRQKSPKLTTGKKITH